MNIYEKIGIEINEDNFIEQCDSIIELKTAYDVSVYNDEYILIMFNDLTELWFAYDGEYLIPEFEINCPYSKPVLMDYATSELYGNICVLEFNGIPTPTCLVHRNVASEFKYGDKVVAKFTGVVLEGDVYETEEELMENHRTVSNAFIPSGLFDEEKTPSAIICGKVIDIAMVENPINEFEYLILTVESLFATYSLIANLKDLSTPPYKGFYIFAQCFIGAQLFKPFIGHEHGNLEVKNKYDDSNTLFDLYEKILNTVDENTTHPTVKDYFCPYFPMDGQCAVVALVVQDYFDGDLARIKLEDGSTHYFNIIDDKIVDLSSLTIGMFYRDYNYDNYEIMSREYVLSYKDTLDRYNILKEKVLNCRLEKKG